jgi:hypothetical protein
MVGTRKLELLTSTVSGHAFTCLQVTYKDFWELPTVGRHLKARRSQVRLG